MGRIARQLELIPARPRTAAERKAEISRRLDGYEYRQAARMARRKADSERRRARPEPAPDPRQVTIDEMMDRVTEST